MFVLVFLNRLTHNGQNYGFACMTGVRSYWFMLFTT